MIEEEHEPDLRARIGRLTFGGGLLVLATGACVTQLGVRADEVGDALAIALVSVALGASMISVGWKLPRSRGERVMTVEPLRTEVLPGGGFDVPFETDPGLFGPGRDEPSLELDILVVQEPVVAGEDWVVVEAKSALFGAPVEGVA